MIKCVAFDVGNVLVYDGGFPESLVINLAEKLKLEVHGLMKRYNKLLPLLESSKKRIFELISPVGKRFYPEIKYLYQKSGQEVFSINNEILDFAKEIKKNFSVGIISNVDRYLVEIPIHQKIYSYFNPRLVVLSCSVGTRKPDQEIYKIFLKRGKFKPEEVIFVDNNKENLITANKLKMHGILFQNNRQFFKDFKEILKQQTELSSPQGK